MTYEDQDQSVPATLLARLVAAPELPGAWQRRILEWGTTNVDTELLCALAARTDLTGDVDAAVRTHPNHEVRADWVRARRGDPEAVAELATAERRVSVLCEIAATPGLPAATVEALAARCRSPHLALTLLENATLDTPTAETLVAVVAASPASHSGELRDRFCSLLRANPELTLAALHATTDPSAALTVLSQGACPPEAVRWAIDTHVTPSMTAECTPEGWRTLCSLLVVLARRCADDPDTAAAVADAAVAVRSARPEAATPALRNVCVDAQFADARAHLTGTGGRSGTRAEAAAALARCLGDSDGSALRSEHLSLVWELLRCGELDDDTFDTLAAAAAAYPGFAAAAPEGLTRRELTAAFGSALTPEGAAALISRAVDRPGAIECYLQRHGPAQTLQVLGATGALTVSELRDILAVTPLEVLALSRATATLWKDPAASVALLEALERSPLADDTTWEGFAACADRLGAVALAEAAELSAAVTSAAT